MNKDLAHFLSLAAPAEAWTDALPMGNGRLGTMSFGGITDDMISLNEDTFWSGYPEAWKDNPHYRAIDFTYDPVAWARAQTLCFEGKYAEAENLLEENFLGPYTEAYLPLGDLHIHYDYGACDARDCEDYERTLEYRTGVHRVSYTLGDTRYEREEFVSHSSNAYFQRIRSHGQELKLKISFSSEVREAPELPASELASLESIKDSVADNVSVAILLNYLQAPSVCMPAYLGAIDDAIIYAENPEKGGMGACSAVMVYDLTGAGSVVQSAHGIEAQSHDLLIVWTAQTTFNAPQKHPWREGKAAASLVGDTIQTKLCNLDDASYRAILDEHCKNFSGYYDRVQWDVMEGDNDEFLAIRRIFNFGRYLMIAASAPDSQALNLQGIWNKDLRAPWSSNYTVNINLEMNYWPVEILNLSEFHEPLLSKIKALSQQGRATAERVYGMPGSVVHHNTDLWNHSMPVGILEQGSVVYSVWPMGLVWLSQHMVRHYEYSLDEDFLRSEVYPVLLDCVRFVLPMLRPNAAGKLVFGPATSPEHWFAYDYGKTASVGEAAAMTQSLIYELLRNFIQGSKILGKDVMVAEAQAALNDLLSLEVGAEGQIKEWSGEWQDGDPHHRHISHLYGLFPGSEINVYDTPELAAAVERALDIRGDEGTGWSLAWKTLCWARLHNSERAYNVLKRQLKIVPADATLNMHDGGGSYLNLFSAHPPFQIDGNLGTTAAIANMFLHSELRPVEGGYALDLELLPALPEAFGTGTIRGLKAKGDVMVSIHYERGRLVSYECEKNNDLVREIRVRS